MSTVLLGLAVSVGMNLVMFVIAYVAQTDKLIDFVYGIDFLVLALFAFLRSPRHGAYAVLLTAAVGLWAVRLAVFLLVRITGKGRDQRFDGRRESFYRFGKVWIGQGLVVWVVSLPTLLALRTPAELTTLAAVGLAVWAAGVVIETVADQQKLWFAADPRNAGRWIATGLWGVSRHPNYFGEILVWVGVYLLALPSLGVAAAVVGLVSPLLIVLLLRFVSGIPILELMGTKRWGTDPAYKAYRARTNLLVPRLRLRDQRD